MVNSGKSKSMGVARGHKFLARVDKAVAVDKRPILNV